MKRIANRNYQNVAFKYTFNASNWVKPHYFRSVHTKYFENFFKGLLLMLTPQQLKGRL